MGYAALSLCFAGVNDLAFKGYGRKGRSTGTLLILAGAVWTLFFLGMALWSGSRALDMRTLLSGSVAGIFSASGNILLIDGMKKSGASIGSTIYRLNLVFAAVMAFFLFGESMGLFKVCGLLCAVAAVALFSIEKGEAGSRAAFATLMILLAASLLRACMGIAYKYASVLKADDALFLAVNGAWWVLSGVLYSSFRNEERDFGVSVLKYGLACGAMLCGVVLFLKLAVNAMDASVAISVSQLSFLATAPLSAIFLKERLTFARCLGMALAVACIVLFYCANKA